MKDWAERYIHDVANRLPEADREEVGRELRANIYDMLPEDAGEEEIKAVLKELGPPAELAEKYRQNPRYLISPAAYGDYANALKYLIPLIGGICLVVGLVMGGIEAMDGGAMVEGREFIASVLSRGLSLGISGVFNALFWCTLGFAIADRAGYKNGKYREEWRVEDLPEITQDSKGKIPLSDSIVELVVMLVFSVIGILLLTGVFPVTFTLNHAEIRIFQLFTGDFLALLIPAVLVTCVLQAAESIAKIVVRRWTPLVCGAVILNSLAGIGIMLFLFTRPQMFSPEFSSFLASLNWGSHDILSFMGNSVEHPVLWIIGAIVVAASIGECIAAIHKTVKAGK